MKLKYYNLMTFLKIILLKGQYIPTILHKSILILLPPVKLWESYDNFKLVNMYELHELFIINITGLHITPILMKRMKLRYYMPLIQMQIQRLVLEKTKKQSEGTPVPRRNYCKFSPDKHRTSPKVFILLTNTVSDYGIIFSWKQKKLQQKGDVIF